MSGSAASGRWTRRDWRSRHCRCHAGLRCNRRAVCCASRCHTRLGSSRRMSCRRKSSRRRPSGAGGRNAGAQCCARRTDSSRGGPTGDSRSRGRCRRSRSGSLRCRDRRCGSRRACSGFGLRGLRLSLLLRLGDRFCRRESLEMLPHKFRVVQVERARVRLLVRDADLWQVIKQDFGLDFEFSGQLVDADLIWI